MQFIKNICNMFLNKKYCLTNLQLHFVIAANFLTFQGQSHAELFLLDWFENDKKMSYWAGIKIKDYNISLSTRK